MVVFIIVAIHIFVIPVDIDHVRYGHVLQLQVVKICQHHTYTLFSAGRGSERVTFLQCFIVAQTHAVR